MNPFLTPKVILGQAQSGKEEKLDFEGKPVA